MDYRLEYITRMLAKISHKRFESYVIHRIWNAIDNPSLQFVCQQYISRDGNKYALADLFLPQLDIVVEINEPAHFKNQAADSLRNYEISKHAEVYVINCFEIVDGKVVYCNLERLNERIDTVIEQIKKRVQATSLIPWKGINSPEEIRERGVLHVEDNVSMRTIEDIANIFGTKPKYKGYLREGGTWVPNKIGEELIWWPNSHHRSWKNIPSADNTTILEYPINENARKKHLNDHINSNVQRITFIKDKDWLGINTYKFVGVYQLNKKNLLKKKCVFGNVFLNIIFFLLNILKKDQLGKMVKKPKSNDHIRIGTIPITLSGN